MSDGLHVTMPSGLYRLWLGAAGALAIGLVAGALVPEIGVAKAMAVAAGALVLAALAWLALWRFELFVLATLILRPIADVSKNGGATGGTSGLVAAGLGVIFLGASIVWYRGVGRFRPAPRSSPVGRALVLLFGACALSVVFSSDHATSAVDFVKIGTAFVMFPVVRRLAVTARARAALLAALLISAVVPIGVGLAQAAVGSGRTIGGIRRLTGTFAHPNGFGFYLVLILLLLTTVIPLLRGWRLLLAGTLGAAAAVCLLLTYSRGSWIALVVGLIVLGIVHDRRILVVLAVASIALVLFVAPAQERLRNLTVARNESNGAGNSLVWRVAYWQETFGQLGRDPVFGIGLNTTQDSLVSGKVPHNDYLRALVEAGVIGLLAFLAVLVAFCAQARRALRLRVGGFDRALVHSFAGVVAAYVVASMGGNLLSHVALLWCIYALGGAVAAIIDSPPSSPSPSPSPEPAARQVDVNATESRLPIPAVASARTRRPARTRPDEPHIWGKW